MKRIVFCLLVLSALFALSCSSSQPGGTGGTGGTDKRRMLKDRLMDVRSVVILVYKDKDGVNKIQVIPETIRLEMTKNQKIRFAVFDNLDEDIESVELNFGDKEPLEGGKVFKIGEVMTGNENETETGKAVQKGTFKYSITVNIKGGKPIVLDPQVEIGG